MTEHEHEMHIDPEVFDHPERARDAFEKLLGRLRTMRADQPRARQVLEAEMRARRDEEGRAMALLKREFEDTYRGIRENLQSRLADKEAKLRERWERTESDLARREAALENEQRRWREESAQARVRLDAEVAAGRAELERERAALSARVKDQDAAHSAAAAKLAAERKSAQEAEQAYREKLKEFEAAKFAELRKVREEYEAKMEARLEALEADHRERKAELEARARDAEKTREKRWEERKADLEKDFEGREEALDERARRLEQEHRANVDAVLAREDEAKRAVAAVRDDAQRRVRELRDELRKKSETLDTQAREREEAFERKRRDWEEKNEVWKINAKGMREQMERDAERQRDEFEAKVRKIEFAKQKLEEEAMWLHRQQQEKRAAWDKELEARDERLRLLLDENERMKLELQAQEVMLKERIKDLEAKNKEATLALRKRLKILTKKEPGAQEPPPAQAPRAGYDLQAVLDEETKGVGARTRDLIFGIAHQIRNPLAIIKTHATYCLEKFKLSGRDREPLLAIVRGVENLGERLEDVLDLTRPRPLKPQAVRFEPLLGDVAALVAERCRDQNVATRIRVPDGIPALEADPTQLREALLQVAVNAVEAMEEGGTLSLGVRYEPERGRLAVEVADTGVGIAPEHLPDVVTPFFSTKPGGVGLGLSLAKQVMLRHGGDLEISRRAEGGTLVRMVLPLEGRA